MTSLAADRTIALGLIAASLPVKNGTLIRHQFEMKAQCVKTPFFVRKLNSEN